MVELNSNPNEAAPVASVPEAVAAPAVTVAPTVAVTPTVTAAPAPVPVMNLAGSVSGTGTPQASLSAGGLGAGAPVAPAKKELPKTTGQTVGGWNRFAGYNPAAAKNKKNDRRGDSSKGGRK
jgi:hypothetical protein